MHDVIAQVKAVQGARLKPSQIPRGLSSRQGSFASSRVRGRAERSLVPVLCMPLTRELSSRRSGRWLRGSHAVPAPLLRLSLRGTGAPLLPSITAVCQPGAEPFVLRRLVTPRLPAAASLLHGAAAAGGRRRAGGCRGWRVCSKQVGAADDEDGMRVNLLQTSPYCRAKQCPMLAPCLQRCARDGDIRSASGRRSGCGAGRRRRTLPPAAGGAAAAAAAGFHQGRDSTGAHCCAERQRGRLGVAGAAAGGGCCQLAGASLGAAAARCRRRSSAAHAAVAGSGGAGGGAGPPDAAASGAAAALSSLPLGAAQGAPTAAAPAAALARHAAPGRQPGACSGSRGP